MRSNLCKIVDVTKFIFNLLQNFSGRNGYHQINQRNEMHNSYNRDELNKYEMSKRDFHSKNVFFKH